MATTIGLPRSLLFHNYHVLWESFFQGLGIETVLSPPSNRAILSRGTELAVDETCLPLKVFLGHVDALRGKADYVLIPRIASLAKGETACVKFLGAYDVARSSVPGVELIEYNVDVENGIGERAELCRVGRKFERNAAKVLMAYARARHAQGLHAVAQARAQEVVLDTPGLKVLVVGHAYNLHDELLGAPIVKQLRSMGADVICSELVDSKAARTLSARLSRDIPWTYNKQLLGAVELYRERVDGIIYLVTFPCGPDSLMTELCTRRVKDVPSMTLILDELQGEAGMKTRLESFVDLLAMRSTGTVAGGGPQ